MSECVQCGAPMQEAQDWCLQCGAGSPDSLGAGGPGWRAAAAILGATGLLVVGASVAAYAALTKPKPKPKAVAVAIRRATAAPTTPAPGTATGGGIPGIPTTVAPAPPKIPTQASTPKSSSEPAPPPEKTTSTNASTEASKGKEGSTEKTETHSGSEPPSPILLDTNAASVYNPYAYPAALFGDPSLAIDGEAKTAWTAQVQPGKAPHMAEGLLLDLKSAQKLGSTTVKTSTTGTTVEVYGANGKTLPVSITDPTWTRLVGLKVLAKKDTTLKLKTKGKSFRYVVLWLVKAPPGSTAANPGDVAIDEFELFPPG